MAAGESGSRVAILVESFWARGADGVFTDAGWAGCADESVAAGISGASGGGWSAGGERVVKYIAGARCVAECISGEDGEVSDFVVSCVRGACVWAWGARVERCGEER